MILYPAASIGERRSGAPALVYSVEQGRVEYGNDYVARPDVAPSGVLFSLWCRIPEQISTYPYTRGNMEVYTLQFGNWLARCIGGNINANSAVDCSYNANSMILCDGTSVGEPNNSYAGDYTYSVDSGLPVAQVNGFVFLAWQFYNDGANLVMRQWHRYAGGALYPVMESIVPYATLRADVVSNAGWNPANAALWTPSMTPVSFKVGSTFSTCNGMYVQARMESTTGNPSAAHILAISEQTGPDPTAWGDWALKWDTDLGAADLTDRSGNGRPLILQPGGTLYQGPLAVLT